MLTIKKCEIILNQNRTEKLSENQVKEIKKLLEFYARLSVEQFKNREE